jgi:rhamnose transport system ATP-binding protein
MKRDKKATQILELRHVYKNYEGVKALSDIKFDLNRGEVHALVGENGAGKSTLVKIIMGVVQANSGEIIYDGKSVRIQNPQVAQHLGIATIFQEISLFPDLTVAENIFIGHEPKNKLGAIDWRKMNEMALKPLEELGVKIDVQRKVLGLSIAEMQMVEIAKALTANAQVLIMDEPTSALTLHEVKDLFRIVNKLRDDNRAIIYISHRLDEIFEIADRVTVFRDGKYVETNDVKDLCPDDLVRMMVGRNINQLYPKIEVNRGEPVLKVTNLAKEGWFEEISFTLHKGEILGLSGLVGARRTEVATTIFGITPADNGEIEIKGNKVKIDNPRKAMTLGMAYVPENRQRHGLVLRSDIRKNISLPTIDQFKKFIFIDRKKELQISKEMHLKMEIRSAGLKQLTQELSGGNQQKVVLAKWLSTNPEILILDEPTRGIDVGTKAAVHELMSKLASEGLAILMISSELEEILGMSDRVLVMCEGRLTGEYERRDANQEKIMADATKRSLAK